MAIGVTKGTNIGIWANDRPNTLLCFYGAVKIGAVPVVLNTSVLPGEIERMALETDVSYLIFDEGYRDIDFVEAIDSFNKLQLKKRIYIGDIPKNNLFSLYDLIECGKGIEDRLENGKSRCVR